MSNFWVKANWSAPINIHAGITTRDFGNSSPPYSKGNLAYHVGDDEKSVVHNRNLLEQYLELPNKPFWLQQSHSAKVIQLQSNVSNNPVGDATYTQLNSTVLAILTADCMPILLCSRDGKEIAAIHAGWRGLSKGIIEQTIVKFSNSRKNILAWIGPAISQQNYEIGTEVREQILAFMPDSVDSFEESRPNHYLMDLPNIAKNNLQALGLNSIAQSNLCTFNDKKRFFSYRRDGVTGRMASLIWIA